MTPVMQTGLTKEDGNCWAACVSSITGIPLADIPVPMCHEENWYEQCVKFLADREWFYLEVPAYAFCLTKNHPDTYIMVAGQSPRYDCLHAVVGQICSGRVLFVHDPHPSGGFIVGDPTYYGFILPKQM